MSNGFSAGYGAFGDKRAEELARAKEEEEERARAVRLAAETKEEEGRAVGGYSFKSSADDGTTLEEAYAMAASAMKLSSRGGPVQSFALAAADAARIEMETGGKLVGLSDSVIQEAMEAARQNALRFEDEETMKRFAKKAFAKCIQDARMKPKPDGNPIEANVDPDVTHGEAVSVSWRPTRKKSSSDAAPESTASSTSPFSCPYDDLRTGAMLPDEAKEKWSSLGVDVTRRQDFLSDAEFETVFKMTKEEYALKPAWKKLDLKKRADLF